MIRGKPRKKLVGGSRDAGCFAPGSPSRLEWRFSRDRVAAKGVPRRRSTMYIHAPWPPHKRSFMLSAYPRHDAQGETLKNSAWVDLLDPTDTERTTFQDAFGLRVPKKEQLAEIEATSRLRTERDALYMTAPLIFAGKDVPWVLLPTGFRAGETRSFDRPLCEIAGIRRGRGGIGSKRAIRFGPCLRPAHGGPRGQYGRSPRSKRQRP